MRTRTVAMIVGGLALLAQGGCDGERTVAEDVGLRTSMLGALLEEARVAPGEVVCLSLDMAGATTSDPSPQVMSGLESDGRLVPFSACRLREAGGIVLRDPELAAMLVSVDSVETAAGKPTIFWGQWYRGPVDAEDFECTLAPDETSPRCRRISAS